MATREYQFIVGPETSTLPNAGTPTEDSEIITLGFVNKVTGTRGSPTNITAGTGITVQDALHNVIFVQGSGGAVDITNDPQISDGTRVGDTVTLIGCSDSNTVTLDHGTGLDINGTIVLDNSATIKLVWDGTNWNEINRRF